MAMQTDLCMQFPWDLATETIGTSAELPMLVLHSGITLFFPIIGMFASQILPSGKRVQMLFVAILNFP